MNNQTETPQVPLPGQMAPVAEGFDPRVEQIPQPPESLQAAGLHPNDIYPLVLKYLFLHGATGGNRIAKQVKLTFPILEPVMASLKADLLVGHKSASGVGDFVYELSPKGVEQAKMHLSRTTYCGAAPVGLKQYAEAVKRQSVRHLKPTFEDVRGALEDLLVSDLLVCANWVKPSILDAACFCLALREMVKLLWPNALFVQWPRSSGFLAR